MLPTWICFLGVFFTLAPDDEDENKEEDEDEAHQGDHHQEPPLLIERRHFLCWIQQIIYINNQTNEKQMLFCENMMA